MELYTYMAVQGFTSVVRICKRPSRACMQFNVMMEIQMDRGEIRTIAGYPNFYPRARPAIGRQYDSGEMMMESRLYQASSVALDRSCRL